MTLFEQNRPLLDAFRQGDNEALGKVYMQYFGDVEQIVRDGFLERRSGNKVPGVSDRDCQAEVIQDVFVSAFSHRTRASYDGIRPYLAFIRAITRHTLIDYWRKRSRDPLDKSRRNSEGDWDLPSPDTLSTTLETPTVNTEEDLHWKRCLDACESYVSCLNPELQRFVQLRFREKQGQLWIAKEMNITRWRVRSLEKRVTSGLRKHLKRLKLVE